MVSLTIKNLLMIATAGLCALYLFYKMYNIGANRVKNFFVVPREDDTVKKPVAHNKPHNSITHAKEQSIDRGPKLGQLIDFFNANKGCNRERAKACYKKLSSKKDKVTESKLSGFGDFVQALAEENGVLANIPNPEPPLEKVEPTIIAEDKSNENITDPNSN